MEKNAKFLSAEGSAPDPRASGAGGFVLRPPKQPPRLRISGYAPATLCNVYNYMGSGSLCFEHFFLDRPVANLMMLTVNVCLMLNCFLVEKFYFHYALCDFDSILLHCTTVSYLFAKVQIAKKILMSLLNSPLKSPAYATVSYHLLHLMYQLEITLNSTFTTYQL